MKRLPLVAIFLLFIALCVSAAYWGMQLFKPPVRQVAAPPQVSKADIKLDAAAGLFGGRAAAVAVATNFQLKGIVLAGKADESIAILAADGKPAQAITVNTEAMPGVIVKEVHAHYILLSEGGVTKRVELPDSAKGATMARVDMVGSSPVTVQPAVPPAAINNQAMPPAMSNPQMPQQQMQSPPALGASPPDDAPLNPGVPGGGGHPGLSER